MADITNEDYANLKSEYDALKAKYDVLEERSNQFDTDIAERDEKIKNLNDALYKAMFTTKQAKPADDNDEPKDFADLYLETLNAMSKTKQV